MKNHCAYCLKVYIHDDNEVFTGLHDYGTLLDNDLNEFHLCSICFAELDYNREQEEVCFVTRQAME